ncbi:MAG: methyltransferase domain-containing protein [Chloroflexi bacterium]|nr:MAG: methyltransferase domain-containing protein [Chloroflexota bacterium]
MCSAGSARAAEWLELRVPASNEAVEAVAEILSRVGHGGGVAIEEPLDGVALPVVKTYIPRDRVARARVRRVKEALGHLGAFGLAPIGALSIASLVEREWLEAWREHYRPLVIGRFLVKPSWIEARADEHLVIELDPGMAFGTGLHPTTQQMLRAMSDLDLREASVLDVGTGSGILALAARAAGAAQVVAIDVDPVAVRVARENVSRLKAHIDVAEAGARDVEGVFDVVLANIVARVIAEASADLRARTRANGTLVVAGIIADAEDDTTAALMRAGFRIASRDVQGDWVSLILR